jgi:2-polyprenyl-3-methyl-5-hydroxy-6-metoxy-1,4-benzoquinol methylase
MTNDDLNLEEEACAFSHRLEERTSNNFIPDLQNYQDNSFFYKSFWRRKIFTDLYVGFMSSTYVSKFSDSLDKNARILDFGCGPGYFSIDLARAGFSVTGYDIADFCIQNANTYIASIDNSGLAGSLQFTSSLEDVKSIKYDAILCSGVLHRLRDLESTLDMLTTLYTSPKSALLLFHEPYHKSWRHNDAFVVAIIRSLLSVAELWYEDLHVKSADDLDKLVNSIYTEYVTERDPHEVDGQSPNDLSCDYDNIVTSIHARFRSVSTWPSRSFIYRVLGGLRSTNLREDALARLLEIIDKVGIDSGFLMPNYMYGMAIGLNQAN